MSSSFAEYICGTSLFVSIRLSSVTWCRRHSDYLHQFILVHVFISIKPGTEQAFHQASLKNARNSAQEPGVARFDVLQDKEDPLKFVLVEVYKTAEAVSAHKETSHYLEWRDAVADMMAEPRSARKFTNLFPVTPEGWDYPTGKNLE